LPGTIEQPHALVNLKVGKKSVVSPFVSLAVRISHINDRIQHPDAMVRLQQCYAETRHPDRLARLFRLDAHPAWQELLQSQRTDDAAKLRLLGQLLYRCDLESLFHDYHASRQSHLRELDRETRTAQRIQPTRADPLSHETVIRYNALDHLRTVLESGMFFSVDGLPAGEDRPSLQSVKDTLSGGRKLDFGGLALEDDVAHADESAEDIDFVRKVFLRVIHPRPGKMKTARLPLAAGRRLDGSHIAVTVHDDVRVSDNPDDPVISNDPKLFGGCAATMLQGLGSCSSNTFMTRLHIWQMCGGLQYTAKGIACAAGQGELRDAITFLIEAGAVPDGDKAVCVPAALLDICRELSIAGLLQADAPGPVQACRDDCKFKLTEHGMLQVVTSVPLGQPRLACAVRTDLALEDMTNYEVAMVLQEGGWQWHPLPRTKIARLALVYAPGGEKQWYSAGPTLTKLYMMALLRAQSLFELGILSIPHWSSRPVEDYRRILKGQAPAVQLPALEADIAEDEAPGEVPADAGVVVEAPIEDGLDEFERALEEILEGIDLVDDVPEGVAPVAVARPPAAIPLADMFDHDADAEYNRTMKAFCRDSPWGPFVFTWKPSAMARHMGAIQVECLFHRLRQSTGCKKTVSLRNRSDDEIRIVMNALRHWCNQATKFNRQRSHMFPFKLDLALTPADGVVTAQKITVGPEHLAKTDDELDAEELAALAIAAAPPLPDPDNVHEVVAAAMAEYDDHPEVVRGRGRGGRGRGAAGDGLGRGGRRGHGRYRGRGRGHGEPAAAVVAEAESSANESDHDSSAKSPDEFGQDSSSSCNDSDTDFDP
jgi:hypothetical protein